MKRTTVIKLLILGSVIPVSLTISYLFRGTESNTPLHIAAGVIIGALFIAYEEKTR